MWLYLDELQFKFEFRSGRMTFGWVMAIELVFFVQIWSCPEFFLTSFDILTWYLAFGYIEKSYSLSSNFFPVEWFLAELWLLNLYFFVQIWSCPDFSLTSFDILTWYLVSIYIGRSYSVRSNFVPVEWLLAELWPLNMYILFKFEVVRSFLWRPLIYWLDIW